MKLLTVSVRCRRDCLRFAQSFVKITKRDDLFLAIEKILHILQLLSFNFDNYDSNNVEFISHVILIRLQNLFLRRNCYLRELRIFTAYIYSDICSERTFFNHFADNKNKIIYETINCATKKRKIEI